MLILNIIIFIFSKKMYCYSMNQNKNTLDAMAQAGHGNKEGHPSSPSKLLSQLAGKTNQSHLNKTDFIKL